MIIERPRYMRRLVDGLRSHQVKVVTGLRRCGKSFLVFNLFRRYLLDQGIPEDHIVEMAFDRFGSRRYRDANEFFSYANERLGSSGTYVVLLDEVQLLESFAEILIDLSSRDNVQVYVTGSNARLLSRDVVTEFRGRSDEIALAPLSFSEFMGAWSGDRHDAYASYATYGGLPGVLGCPDDAAKADYLESLVGEVYVRDLVERNAIRDVGNLEDLLEVVASSIGSLTNPRRLSDTFRSEKHVSVSPETVEHYLGYFEDAFLTRRAKRFDVRGRRYISTPSKYYFSDIGVRNAVLSFRQLDDSHIMENIIFNELVGRGYHVDVGVVPVLAKDAEGHGRRMQLEIDFVCNRGSERCYVQSALLLPTTEKRRQEERPYTKVSDSFKKVIVTKEGLAPHYTDDGILMMNVYDFLMDPESLSG